MFKPYAALLCSIVLLSASWAGAAETDSNVFIQPTGAADATPIWGVRGGMTLGLWPTPGPRGLLRIYTPYLDQKPLRVFNFIAVEPIVNGMRDLSELQRSSADHKPGKPMWTTDTLDLEHPDAFTATPARGSITQEGNASVLRFYVHVEKFNNGAQPVVEVTFHSDRPHEVELATFTTPGAATMSQCVLTATMGNWARLRHLHLKDQTVDASTAFHGQVINPDDFFETQEWPASALTNIDGRLTVSATGDPDAQPEPEEVPRGWRYSGKQATQTWSTPARAGVTARVNGREVFWASHAKVPGGPAFENFEMMAPFQDGETWRYAVEERTMP